MAAGDPRDRPHYRLVVDEQDAIAIASRMLRAGSPLRTADDFLAAEGALARMTGARVVFVETAAHIRSLLFARGGVPA